MRFVGKRSCCQFLCHNSNKKINLWRLRKPSLTLTDQSFIISSFILFSQGKTKLLAREETFYQVFWCSDVFCCSVLCFNLCPSEIAVQVNRSHINEKSQLAQSTSDNNLMIQKYFVRWHRITLKRFNERISCTQNTKLLNHTYIISKTAEITSILNVNNNGTDTKCSNWN